MSMTGRGLIVYILNDAFEDTPSLRLLKYAA